MSNNATLNVLAFKADYEAAIMEAELNGIKDRSNDTYHRKVLGHFEALEAIAAESQRRANEVMEGEVVEDE